MRENSYYFLMRRYVIFFFLFMSISFLVSEH
jgi:hypothetical protein